MKNALGLVLFSTAISPLAVSQAQPPSVPLVKASRVSAPAPKPVCSGLGAPGNWDQAAQFIAGMSDKLYADALNEKQRTAWNIYVTAANTDWNGLGARYLEKISTWRGHALAEQGNGGVAFYPFSGPDAANVITFFPHAQEYVMIGLEPVGCLPASAADYPPGYFSDLRRSLQSAMGVGFFRTNDMRRDFNESQVSGVLPLLLLELARTGNTVASVQAIAITPEGGLADSATAAVKEAEGVAIQFKRPDKSTSTLRYFSLNLHNDGLKQTPGAMHYLQNLAVNGTMVKSASYLMHKRYFSTVRGLILDKAQVLVQDDSGVPFHHFDATWDVHLYGTYRGPIPMFALWTQQSLQSAYQTRTDIEPLDFGMGYKWKPGTANLLVARHRTK